MQQQTTATSTIIETASQTRMREMYELYHEAVENKSLVSNRLPQTEIALEKIGQLAQDVLGDKTASYGDRYRVVQFVSDMVVGEIDQNKTLLNNADNVSADQNSTVMTNAVQKMRDNGIDTTELDRVINSKSYWLEQSGRHPSSPRLSVQHLIA